MVNAIWFDGTSTVRHTVQWQLEGDTLQVQHGDVCMRHPARSLKLPEPARGADRPVGLPDGSVLWLDAASAVQGLPALQRAAARRPGVAALIGSWPAVAACLVALVAGLWWFNHQGAGLLGRAALPLMPRTVDQKIGQLAWPQIERTWLAPTVNFERCLRLRDRFMAVAERFDAGTVVLTCARARKGNGFNAFVLPDGHIVLLDGLLNWLDDDEVMAVLGHELGHVVHRHSMQSLMQSMGLAAVAGVVMGNFSSVAATTTAGLQGLAYRRDAEREADRFALEFLAAAGIDPVVMKRVWLKFMAAEKRGGGMPAWTSSHPPTEERLRALQPR
jgi:Zn-dependent protease with chaperone function